MKHFDFLKLAILLIASYVLPSGTGAQNNVQSSPSGAASCPAAKQLKPAQIHGLWRVRFSNPPTGLPAEATLLLERHAEFGDSVAGFVSRDLGVAAGTPPIAGHAAKAQLAGDLEDGLLTLDESSDGISITGTWNGEIVEGSCGKKVSGLWKDTSNSAPPDASEIPFTLERLSGW